MGYDPTLRTHMPFYLQISVLFQQMNLPLVVSKHSLTPGDEVVGVSGAVLVLNLVFHIIHWTIPYECKASNT
jgi:hypothetical protein